MRLTLLIFLCLITGCSLYQSDARKFLEKEAFEYAGVSAHSYLKGCSNKPFTRSWVPLAESESALVYTSTDHDFKIRVLAHHPSIFHYCDFGFSTHREQVALTESAIEVTLLSLSLGEFAFHLLNPVK